MTSRRELLTSVLLCLIGSALVLFAVSRAWIVQEVPATPPLPSKAFTVAGTRLAPGARALALVGVAAVAAVAATKRLGRLFVGALVALAGVGIVAVVGRALADPGAALSRVETTDHAYFPHTPGLGPWPYVALVGAVLVMAGGLLVVVRGRSWASMSARYDGPAQKPRGEGSLWDALDRGEDPTDAVTDRGD